MTAKLIIREAGIDDIPILTQNNLALAKETEGLQLDNDVLRQGIEQALTRK
ncbi:MAG: GNAT family N-acetyltransferase, partial [Nitrospinaceae bacterium]|nr:GNAT family N-acetyltransferase [Nitrospinaceae bacterium]